MKFGPVPIKKAVGKILGHNVAGEDGRRLFRKGKELSLHDIELLDQIGLDYVYVAELEDEDVGENEAARRIVHAVMGPHLYLTGPATGRVNIKAETLGVMRVHVDGLQRVNSRPGVTLATLPAHTAVPAGKMVATAKIIPYAVPEAAVAAVESIAGSLGPLIALEPLRRRRVDLILSGSLSARERIMRSFDPPLRQRIEGLGAELHSIDFVPLVDEAGSIALAEKLQLTAAAGSDLILLAGETAIMDRHDMAPRALEMAGGSIVTVGAPVDPGNLLMLGYIGRIPVLGAPGCARSPKRNIIDELLPRLLVGDQVTQMEIIALGHGGLLEDVPERPYPRSRVSN